MPRKKAKKGKKRQTRKPRAILNSLGNSEETSDEIEGIEEETNELENDSKHEEPADLEEALPQGEIENTPSKAAELEKEALPQGEVENASSKTAELEKEALPQGEVENASSKTAELEEEALPPKKIEIAPAEAKELVEKVLSKTKELRVDLNKNEAINEKDSTIRMKDKVLVGARTEFQQELEKYSRKQQTLIKSKAVIDRLSKELHEIRMENEKSITKLKMELSGKDLEVVALKQAYKDIMEENRNLKRIHARIRNKFQTDILNEVKHFLEQKLDVIEQTEPEIEKQIRPLEIEIEELKELIQQKDIQIGLHLKEMNKLKTKLTRMNNTYGRMKKVYDRVIQQNKELRKELQKRMEFNEILKKELDKINEELSQ